MNLNVSFKEKSDIQANFREKRMMATNFGETVRVSVDDYELLRNKPRINDVELIGNRTGEELNLQDLMNAITNVELALLLT